MEWEIKPCKSCGKTPEKMFSRVYCRACWEIARQRGVDNRKAGITTNRAKRRLGKQGLDNRLLLTMRKVMYASPKEAEAALKKLFQDNPAKYFDIMTKLEPKNLPGEGGPKVVIIHLPHKAAIGAECPQPAADTVEAVDKLVRELEDKTDV